LDDIHALRFVGLRVKCAPSPMAKVIDMVTSIAIATIRRGEITGYWFWEQLSFPTVALWAKIPATR